MNLKKIAQYSLLPAFLFIFSNIGYSIPTLEVFPKEINIMYTPGSDAESSASTTSNKTIVSTSKGETSQNTNKDIPVNLSVTNDLKSYKLGVSLTNNLYRDGISLFLDVSGDITNLNKQNFSNEVSISNSSFEVTENEILFFENEDPDFEIQQIDLRLNATISDEIKSGTFQTGLKFVLYQNNEAVAEKEINITISIEDVLSLEVTFLDATYEGLDFGIINTDLQRIDKKINLKINSNLGEPFRIFQRRAENMKSNVSNIEMDEKAIFYEVNDEGIKGKAYHDKVKNLEVGDDIIYESDGAGSGDSFSIIYSLQNTPNLKCGKYKSSLSFFMEPADKNGEFQEITVTFDLLAEVEKIFLFNLYPEKDAANMDFTPGTLDTPVVDKMLKVEIVSNTGKPYRFYHSLPNGLLNNEGGKLENKNISFALCDSNGTVLPGESPEDIGINDQLILESNPNGDPGIYYIRYKVKYDKIQMAGAYRSDLQFVLSDD
ncbi:MAG: hypothetical protein ACD_79C00215G0002 [uncultured bacterium]|nr:MAG: hypothetical protein ACD_79C00215G0002 [uncultured bacterium]